MNIIIVHLKDGTIRRYEDDDSGNLVLDLDRPKNGVAEGFWGDSASPAPPGGVFLRVCRYIKGGQRLILFIAPESSVFYAERMEITNETGPHDAPTP